MIILISGIKLIILLLLLWHVNMYDKAYSASCNYNCMLRAHLFCFVSYDAALIGSDIPSMMFFVIRWFSGRTCVRTSKPRWSRHRRSAYRCSRVWRKSGRNVDRLRLTGVSAIRESKTLQYTSTGVGDQGVWRMRGIIPYQFSVTSSSCPQLYWDGKTLNRPIP